MDQAVSVLAQEGRAMHVQFNPVSCWHGYTHHACDMHVTCTQPGPVRCLSIFAVLNACWCLVATCHTRRSVPTRCRCLRVPSLWAPTP
jgi:hypothetical protein